MNNFNNSEYESMVKDLLGDTFYTETSYRGKIASLRSYAEVIVRKLLDLNPDMKMTLGQKDIKVKINLLNNSELILKSIKTINTEGSSYIHTQKIMSPSNNEFDNVVNSTLDLLSVLLINYFQKYRFGSKSEVMHSFSILPPIVRYKTLKYLYESDPQNIFVIDKLVLSILKALDKEHAVAWVEERKNVLSGTLAKTEVSINSISPKQGFEFETIEIDVPNMYQMCCDKIEQVASVINHQGVLYSNFEDALTHYKENGVLVGSEPEIAEFNDIMSFLYLGRKEDIIRLPKDKTSYIIMNFIS